MDWMEEIYRKIYFMSPILSYLSFCASSFKHAIITTSRYTTVAIVTAYQLEDTGTISRRDKKCFSIPQGSHRFCSP
jgi:hypothetical protein